MDSIFIRGLQLDTLIGVYDSERHHPQQLLVDLDLYFDNRPAAASDRLDDTIDYAQVAQVLREYAAASQHQLLEVLAEDMATLLQRRFCVLRLGMSIHKPAAAASLQCATLGVRIERDFSAS